MRRVRLQPLARRCRPWRRQPPRQAPRPQTSCRQAATRALGSAGSTGAALGVAGSGAAEGAGGPTNAGVPAGAANSAAAATGAKGAAGAVGGATAATGAEDMTINAFSDAIAEAPDAYVMNRLQQELRRIRSLQARGEPHFNPTRDQAAAAHRRAQGAVGGTPSHETDVLILRDTAAAAVGRPPPAGRMPVTPPGGPPADAQAMAAGAVHGNPQSEGWGDLCGSGRASGASYRGGGDYGCDGNRARGDRRSRHLGGGTGGKGSKKQAQAPELRSVRPRVRVPHMVRERTRVLHEPALRPQQGSQGNPSHGGAARHSAGRRIVGYIAHDGGGHRGRWDSPGAVPAAVVGAAAAAAAAAAASVHGGAGR